MRPAPAVATVAAVQNQTRAWVVDGALAVAFAALSLSLIGGFTDDGGRFRGAAGLAVVSALLHCGAIAWRRRVPEAALAVSLLAGLGYAISGFPMVGLGPTVLVPVYTVAALVAPRRSLVGLAATEAAAVVAQLLAAHPASGDTMVGNAVVLGAAWLLGDQARRRRDEATEHERRALRLEAAEGELARLAVAEERHRIARELHDVVAHSMSVIAVHAGTGRMVIDTDPAAARDALATIETTSRQALDEMRRLLGVLRDDDEPGSLAPAPGLAELDVLVANAVGTGLPVDVRVEGERRALPPGVDLAAFRILQEALTNVSKHAAATRADVHLAYGDDALAIEVSDDGRGHSPGKGNGHGIVGMHERAAMYGGTLVAGPAPGGGFRVQASLPYDGRPR
jgi:signal transduction histidine kinase